MQVYFKTFKQIYFHQQPPFTDLKSWLAKMMMMMMMMNNFSQADTGNNSNFFPPSSKNQWLHFAVISIKSHFSFLL